MISASAFVAGDPTVSAADFDRWMESVHAMQRYPELQDIGLVVMVRASELSAFKARMAADGPFAFIVPIDPEQTYFPKISSRITASGSMESNPIDRMRSSIRWNHAKRIRIFEDHDEKFRCLHNLERIRRHK